MNAATCSRNSGVSRSSCSSVSRQPVRHLHVPAAQLAQQLDVVVAGDDERAAGLHHFHDDPQHVGHARAAIDQVAKEDSLAPSG